MTDRAASLGLIDFDRPVVAIDIAKDVFQIHAYDHGSKKTERVQVTRSALLRNVAKRPPSVIAMEACGGAHHWARSFEKMGHQIRLLPAAHVSPFCVGDKTDSNDAQAIYVAAQQRHIKSVPVKTINQQALLAIHRMRALLMKTRISQSNSLRGILSEFGIVVPKGFPNLMKRIDAALERAVAIGVPQMAIASLQELVARIRATQQDLDKMTERIERESRESEVSRTLMEIPGIGPIGATALSTTDLHRFKSGRAFAAWLGLTPRQSGTGGKVIQLGLNKRGDQYLRMLIMQGARAVVSSSPRNQTDWVKGLLSRRPAGVVAGAMAGRIARTVWAVLVRGDKFDYKAWGLAYLRSSFQNLTI